MQSIIRKYGGQKELCGLQCLIPYMYILYMDVVLCLEGNFHEKGAIYNFVFAFDRLDNALSRFVECDSMIPFTSLAYFCRRGIQFW